MVSTVINFSAAVKPREMHMAVAVASPGIADKSLTRGRTAHSIFKLPLNLNRAETPMCNTSILRKAIQWCDLRAQRMQAHMH